MITEEKFAALLALHSPEAVEVDGMVYQVWEDGEVTLTKSGSLFGQRNLHTVCTGDPRGNLIGDREFPLHNYDKSHSNIAVKDEIAVDAALALLRGPCPYSSGKWFV